MTISPCPPELSGWEDDCGRLEVVDEGMVVDEGGKYSVLMVY